MRKTFVRILVVNAVLQFFVTRRRAGQTFEEGAAEMLWMRYPLSVLANALAWTLMLTALGRVAGVFRGER